MTLGLAPAGAEPGAGTDLLLMLVPVSTVAVPVVTLLTASNMWIREGCQIFMPFISDLGLEGSMRTTFTVGLVATGVLLVVVSLLLGWARWQIATLCRLGFAYRVYSVMVVFYGFAIAVGVLALPFYPWHEDLYPHLVFANAIFFGGTGWATFNFLCMRCGVDSEGVAACRRWQTMLMKSAWVSLAAMLLLLSDFGEDPSLFLDILQVAKTDFPKYCNGEAWPQPTTKSMAAFFEWTLILSLIAGVATLSGDLELWLRLRKSPKLAAVLSPTYTPKSE